METFGWVVIILLALSFMIAGALCAIGVSDSPRSRSWTLLIPGLIFAAIGYTAFPF